MTEDEADQFRETVLDLMDGDIKLPTPGTRVSHCGKEVPGLFVQVNVPEEELRENTRHDHAHNGEYGFIPADQSFTYFPVEVIMEKDGKLTQERVMFWRHSLVVVDSYTCVECQGTFRGVDYLCENCRG